MYSMGGNDPRLEKYNKLIPNGLNRWVARHPLLTPLIGFAILGFLTALDNLAGRPWGLLTRVGALIGIISCLLLIYGVILTALNLFDRRPGQRR